jgi:tRNA/tmRNA/rRNA uracil-C5-methylase (TrmA/RlmC/RlmD family)
MKVQDLIELLQGENPEAEVHFQYNYGDHWRTQVAPTVDSVENGYVTFSDYHRMHKVVDEDDFDYDEETGEPVIEGTAVVILG